MGVDRPGDVGLGAADNDPIVTFTAVCEPAYDEPLPVKVNVIVPRLTAVPPVFRTFTTAITQRSGRTVVVFVITVSIMMFACDWMFTTRVPVALNVRFVISSFAPDVVDKIFTAAELDPAAIVIKKSM